MYPGFIHWWKEAQRHASHAASCGAGCAAAEQGHRHRHRAPDRQEAVGEDGGGAFGVRRPLRFMAWKLELNEEQVDKLAAVLADLKTERAQAAVDHQRSVGNFADVLAAEAFDKDAAKNAAHTRVVTAERLRDAVVKALEKTHGLLNPEQRKQLAYLLRSGQLTI